MALDGIAISNIIYECEQKLLGGRIDKIYQPNRDEIILSFRSIGANFKLLLSANPSHPRIHITKIQKENPMTAPLFCMVMRKYAAGGKLVAIRQPSFERIVEFHVESMNEMGDKAVKRIIVEIMGKYSNIILVDENNIILDSIKRVSHDKSSVRLVLPGQPYVMPPSQQKLNPMELKEESFSELAVKKESFQLQPFLYQSYTGISPVMASEICVRAGLDPSAYMGQLSPEEKNRLFQSFSEVTDDIKAKRYFPEIIYDPKNGRPYDFFSLQAVQFEGYDKKPFDSISELLETFYYQKDNAYHIAQKAHDMRKLVTTNIERCVKKKEIQNKTLKDIENKDEWKLKGELITANIYSVQKGQTMLKAENFYSENPEEIEIALDPTKTPSENAQKYFSRYNKAKRTLAALEIQIKQNDEELEYLENVLIAIENAADASDLSEIREELAQQGFVKRKAIPRGKQPRLKKSQPYHFLSSDGFDLYVGKSNTQNDELTLKFAQNDDIWLHTKNIPGSHVIIKTGGTEEIPDQTLLEACNLAAYHSKA